MGRGTSRSINGRTLICWTDVGRRTHVIKPVVAGYGVGEGVGRHALGAAAGLDLDRQTAPGIVAGFYRTFGKAILKSRRNLNADFRQNLRERWAGESNRGDRRDQESKIDGGGR